MTNNMRAVGWGRWLMALGIPMLFASEYGRSMEHKGLVYYIPQSPYPPDPADFPPDPAYTTGRHCISIEIPPQL